MKTTITGLDKLMTKLARMGGDVKEVTTAAIADTTLAAQGSAKALVPVKTGNLKNNIFTDMEVEGDKISGAVYDNVEYAIHVELGTHSKDARPFLKPALEENRDTLMENLRERVQAKIRALGG